MLKTIRKKVSLVATICIGSVALVHGAGFQLYTEGSTEALALGGAISARHDMISNAWYNPASLAGAEKLSLMIGNSMVQLNTEYSENGYEEDMERRWRNIPHFFYVQPISESLTAMLSINAPYGLTTEWQSNWNGNLQAVDTSLATMFITPSLALKVNEKLSLSAGVSVVRADLHMRKKAHPVLPGILSMDADDIGFGYSLGINYDLNEEWTIAAKFQSRVELKMKGRAELHSGHPILIGMLNGKVNGDVTLPASITLGFANRSIENWVFGLDVLWSEWSNYDSLTYNFASGFTSYTPKDWKDVYSIRLGAEYAINENWCLRFGYVWDESPIKEETRAPEMPSGDRHMFSIGTGYKRDNWGVDLGYSYILVRKADVGVATGLSVDGEYNTNVNILSISFNISF